MCWNSLATNGFEQVLAMASEERLECFLILKLAGEMDILLHSSNVANEVVQSRKHTYVCRHHWACLVKYCIPYYWPQLHWTLDCTTGTVTCWSLSGSSRKEPKGKRRMRPPTPPIRRASNARTNAKLYTLDLPRSHIACFWFIFPTVASCSRTMERITMLIKAGL